MGNAMDELKKVADRVIGPMTPMRSQTSSMNCGFNRGQEVRSQEVRKSGSQEVRSGCDFLTNL